MDPNSTVLGDDRLVSGGNGFQNPEIELIVEVKEGPIDGFQRVSDGGRRFFGCRRRLGRCICKSYPNGPVSLCDGNRGIGLTRESPWPRRGSDDLPGLFCC